MVVDVRTVRAFLYLFPGAVATSRAGLFDLLLLIVLTGAACKGQKPAAQPGQAGPPPAVIVAEVVRRTVPVYGEYVAQTVANSTDIPARVEATRISATSS
jgi:hypothetical protein